MNHQRLLKEVRVLLPAWVCSAVLIVGPEFFLKTYPDAANLCWVMFVTGCTLLGVLSFGVEYESQTMPAFLSQPVSRRTLWNEKVWILAAALLALYAVFLGALAVAHRVRPDTYIASVQALGWILVPFCALGGGPCFTLSRRNTLYGAVLTILLVFMGVIGAISDLFLSIG